MDFEQLAEKYRTIKSPEIQSNHSESDNSRANFLEFLQNELAETKRKYRQMYILYGIGAVVYLAVFGFNPDSELTTAHRFAGLFYFLAFVMLLFISRKRFSELKRTSFLKTPVEFLKDARGRYTLWNKRQRWLIPVLLLVNCATTLSSLEYFGNVSLLYTILWIQLIFWGLMTLGFYMGKRKWRKNKRPILLKIEEMLASFEQ